MKYAVKTVKNTSVNQSIQLCKLIASMFVVFIHFGFPGRLGTIIDCLARFAVPMFFTISGYFSYQINNQKITKRIIHMLKLNIIAVLLYIILNLYETKYIFDGSLFEYLQSVFNLTTISKWIIINLEPVAGHLWYLSAILTCYILLWVYVRFFDKDTLNYHPLYIISICMLMIHIIFGTNAMAAGMDVPYIIYRNALFWGIPMFCIGIFIRQYQKRILDKYNLTTIKQVAIIIFGALLSLLQYTGIGKTEMPIGIIFVVVALMLLLASHPTIPLFSKKNNIVLSFNYISLVVYIVHPAVNWLFTRLHGSIPICIHENAYIYPIIILVMSIICGIVFTLILQFVKYIKIRKT